MTKSPEKGVPIQNPFRAIMNRQAEIMLRAASELDTLLAERHALN